MKKLFLDIETLPADEDKHAILRGIYEDKIAKGKKIGSDLNDYIRQTSFDGSFGRIFCISVAINDNPTE